MTHHPNQQPPKSNFLVKSIAAIVFIVAFCVGLEHLPGLGLNPAQTKSFIYTGVIITFAFGIIVTENN